MSEIIDINEIRQYIPHRYPFLLVDRIVEIELGKRAMGLKNVTINEPFFPGHFPHNPVMPGVLIIEALAQAAAVLAFKTEGTIPDKDAMVYFASVDNVRFKRPVVPGDQLMLDVEMVRTIRNIWKCKGVARVAGEVATEAEFMCAIKR